MRRTPTFSTFALLASTAVLPAQISGIGPTGPVVKLGDWFRFTEGPAATRDGLEVYFSDLGTHTVYATDLRGRTRVVLRNSRYTNGLAIDRSGRLVGCQGQTGRVVRIDRDTGALTTLASTYGGKRFNEPNDLAIDAFGGLWFTDPWYRPDPAPQGLEAVYYVAPGGGVSRATTALPHPNGIQLSPDEKTLYVSSDGATASVWAFPVLAPGRLGAGREIARWSTGRIDGMTVDSAGNLYVTRPLADRIEVLDPSGKVLGGIPVPYHPGNVAFAGADGRTLVVAARATLLAAPMAIAGHRPAWLETSAISLPTSGGSVAITLHASAIQAGRDYALLLGASGSYPGLSLAGLRVPVVFDDLVVAALAAANTPTFAGFVGRLDAAGVGRARLALPPLDPSLAGLRLTLAGVLAHPEDRATNAHTLELSR